MSARMKTKYYVESGPQLMMVVLAHSTSEAIFAVLEGTDDEPLGLAEVIIVNQRGFVWNREEHCLYGDETIVPTRLLLGDPLPYPVGNTTSSRQ